MFGPKNTAAFSFKLSMIVLVVLLLGSTALGRGRENKFLIIHLDATSSEDFFAALEAGHLPNIADLFQNGQHVRHGLTLYPGGTEIIMPRIKLGADNSQGKSIGWGYLDRENDREVGIVPVFLEMFSGFPRRSRHHFAVGLPPLHHVSGLSLLNLDRIWETQDVVELYWFHSDVAGHMFGREAHLKSLRTLDHYLGVVAKSGRLDGANLVLYSDHGMVTKGVETVRYHAMLTELIQDELRYLDYPNIYLHDPDEKYRLAQEIAENTEVDISLVRVSEDLVRGYTSHGYFEILHKDGTYVYSAVGDDYFGYQALGLEGVYLPKDEWLRQTKEYIYPALPPNFYNYLSNPQVGEIVAILDSPKIPRAVTAMKGNHSGVTSTDLLVPLLLVGPAFQGQEQIEEFWLHELYTVHLPMIDFETKELRERHMVSLGYPGRFELVLSPAARWRGGVSLSEQGLRPWLEYDLYSSFLTRVWIGANLGNEGLGWQVRMEAFLGDLGVSMLKRSGEEGLLHFHWRFTDRTELTIAKGMAGISLLF